jgi:plastocyanin
MKKVTLLAAMMIAMVSTAQQTFMVDWDQSTESADATFTLLVGDTVMWTWANVAPHDVQPASGEMDAPDDFGSEILTGMGSTYSYTFTTPAVIDYLCTVHPGAMNGTLTVEAVMSVQDQFERNITFFPNPVKEDLKIRSLFSLDTYEIYSATGKKVSEGVGEGTYTNLNTSHFPAGVYFVTVRSNDLTATIKLVKE